MIRASSRGRRQHDHLICGDDPRASGRGGERAVQEAPIGRVERRRPCRLIAKRGDPQRMKAIVQKRRHVPVPREAIHRTVDGTDENRDGTLYRRLNAAPLHKGCRRFLGRGLTTARGARTDHKEREDGGDGRI